MRAPYDMTIDPVCGMPVDEDTPAVSLLYRGRIYHFCTVACKRRFQKDPDRYAITG